MSLIIKHCFPLGRFHATRWRQNPFEDRYGEWPPSPWRLLRTLAARWFQYSREIGSFDEQTRNVLLSKLASSMPVYLLPALSFSGPALIQYHPTNIDWTAAGYRKPKRTKTEDHYRTLPTNEPLYWIWDVLELDNNETALLDHLLERILYFGRAESYCRLRRVMNLPPGAKPNCQLLERGDEDMPPVLAPIPESNLNIEALLAITDDKRHLKGRPVPPGTAWFFAQLPAKPPISVRTRAGYYYPKNLHCIQFAVGGRVYPPQTHWIKITERFRGNVIRCLAQQISPASDGRYDRLTTEEKNILALVTGKDSQSKPLKGHRHAFFLLWPDANGFPTRLIVWRKESFTEDEIEALLCASEKPLMWGNDSNDWKLRIVPLPFEILPPQGLSTESKTWISATPFVPPANRYRFRKNGQLRTIESVEHLLSNLLKRQDKPEPKSITLIDNGPEQCWLKLHETRERRFLKEENRTPYVRPGFYVRIEFSSPVQGPLILGDSSHFGLGLFVPETGGSE